MPPPQEGSEAHSRGLPLLGAIQAAFLPYQGVPSAPAPRRQRAWRQMTRRAGAHPNLAPAVQAGAEAHAAGLPLLWATYPAFLTEQRVRIALGPSRQRVWKRPRGTPARPGELA